MSNTLLTADIIAKEAVTILENELVMANLVYRGHEDEFDKKINGYEVGETISMRRPADFTVRSGAVAATQDVVEGKVPVTVDTQIGVDFKFTSRDLTMSIGDISERAIKPAMVQLANYIDADLMSLYKYVPQHVTLPSGGIDSFADFALAPTLMDNLAVPSDERYAVLNPSDYWAMLGSQTALYMQDVAKGAFRTARMGMVGNVDTYMSQNAPTHITGDRTGTDAVDIGSESYALGHTWANVKNSTTVTFHIDGFNASTSTVKAGDTFTISDVYDVNPVSKAPLATLKKFVCMTDFQASGSEGDIQIWPPIILSGAKQNAYLSTGTLEDNTITYQGVASTAYRQNLFFRRNAFHLTMVPMVKPPGAIDVGRRTYKGISVRIIPVYDGINDHSMWRCDVLYGKGVLDSRQAVRASLAADI